jgi:hypothetical protein
MILGFFFGWNWRVRRLRRKWDRVREKSLKKKGQLRAELLARLDIVENQLRMMEEQRLTRLDRRRFYREVAVALAEIREILKMKEESAQPKEKEKKS